MTSETPTSAVSPPDSSAGAPEKNMVNPAPQPQSTGTEASAGTIAGAPFRSRRVWVIAGLVVLASVGALIWRSSSRSTGVSSASTEPSSAQSVAAARVTREDLYNEVTMYAEFRPYEEVELHAKVSGYVSEINVDFGDRVKSNQLLARLEVPELHDELDNALAIQKRAEADYADAHLSYTRLLAVEKGNPNLVAQQDLDTAEAKDRTTEAAIAGAKANVEKYQTLLAYTRICAPFDGIVTRRYVDKGALIQSGTASETQSLPVVRVSDNYRLRLDFPVSVAYVKDVRVGDSVEVRVDSLGGKTFSGSITRATLSVNEETRTMMTEIEVPNPDLELVPGMYAAVVLKVQRHLQALAIPIEAVPPGQTSSVYVITDKNEIEERPVKLGLDTPTRYEVLSGLQEGEMVLMGSRSQTHPGQKVQPKLMLSLSDQPNTSNSRE